MRKRCPPPLEKSVERSGVNNSTFYETFERLKIAVGARTDTDLANAIGLKHSTISAAKSKSEIPPGWIVDISRKFGVSLDWLVYGDQNPITTASTPKVSPVSDPFPQIMEDELSYIRELRQENRDLRQENRELRQENKTVWQESREIHAINRSQFKEIYELKAEIQQLQDLLAAHTKSSAAS